MHGRGACVVRGVHGRVVHGGGHVCVAGGGVCMAEGHTWQGTCMVRHDWQGACIACMPSSSQILDL